MTSIPGNRRALPIGARIDNRPAADGWPLRRITWEATGTPPRGSILFQGGRGDILEKYLETFAHWHGQGWTIGGFDWRGQGGSGRLTPDRPCGDIEDFGQFIADLADFWTDWTQATPGPHVIVGHSMGGHLILRALVEGAITPAAAVLVAPMLGLHAPVSTALGEGYARLMAAIGDPARPAWKGNEKPYTRTARAKLLTHDAARYEDEIWWHAHDPSLFTGPPSWRWLAQAFASTRTLNADSRLASLETPLLMLVAEADQLVDPRTALAVAARLPHAQVVRFGSESAHEILREADPVRNRALAEIDAFLQQHA